MKLYSNLHYLNLSVDFKQRLHFFSTADAANDERNDQRTVSDDELYQTMTSLELKQIQ